MRPNVITSPQTLLLRFYCRSDSTVKNLGELIGPDGTAITSNDVFEISTNRIGGEIEVVNFVGSNDVTSSEQGVYTCRIPLQSGVIREINIGIYPNVFNSEFIVTVNRGVFIWGFTWFTGSTLGLECGRIITSVKARLCALHRVRLKGGVCFTRILNTIANNDLGCTADRASSTCLIYIEQGAVIWYECGNFRDSACRKKNK